MRVSDELTPQGFSQRIGSMAAATFSMTATCESLGVTMSAPSIPPASSISSSVANPRTPKASLT